MEPPRLRCVLVLPDGPSRRVGPKGVIIGRQKDCDIVTLEPSVSRRHALVRITADGVEVVPLGRAPVEINGKASDRPHPLGDGDRLAVPGLSLTVKVEAARPDPAAPGGFVLQREKGGSFGIAHTPFVIGGGETDDLIIKKWPEAVLSLHVAQGELFVELRAGKAEHGGEPLETGVLEPLAVGETLSCRGEAFTIAYAGAAATTAVAAKQELPIKVEIEMLPRGGRVVFTLAVGERAVYLSDRRFDFLMVLLKSPGEFVSDDNVRGLVWPKNHAVSRPEINMLISRCRRDLLDAGLAGPRLIERAPGGGGTRVALAPGAEVVIRQ